MSHVLSVLCSLGADPEEDGVEFATLLAQVKMQASDKGEPYEELAEVAEDDFEYLLHDLFDVRAAPDLRS